MPLPENKGKPEFCQAAIPPVNTCTSSKPFSINNFAALSASSSFSSHSTIRVLRFGTNAFAKISMLASGILLAAKICERE